MIDLDTPKTCSNCIHRIGEECGITGEDIFEDEIRDCCEVIE
jgi:hypothetical protein